MQGIGTKMALFTGKYENKIDQKGRVSLPADFRDLLSENNDSRSFYIFPSPNLKCLEASDKIFIERIIDSIQHQVDIFSDQEVGHARLIAEMRRIQYDSTGRFVMPSDFLAYADIKNNAIFVASLSRFQIWNPSHYRAHLDQQQSKTSFDGLKLQQPRLSKGDDR